MDLISYLERQNTGIEDTSLEWKLFLLDHKSKILENSSIMVLNDVEMYKYKYRLKAYLKSKQINPGLINIVMMLNNLVTDLDFINVDQLHIPSNSYIRDLRNTYFDNQSAASLASK